MGHPRGVMVVLIICSEVRNTKLLCYEILCDKNLILPLFFNSRILVERNWRGFWNRDEECSSGWQFACAIPHRKFVLINVQERKDSDYLILEI